MPHIPAGKLKAVFIHLSTKNQCQAVLYNIGNEVAVLHTIVAIEPVIICTHSIARFTLVAV
jgi:hypothetical protein